MANTKQQFRRKMKVDELAKMDTEDVAGCSMDEMYKFYQAVTIERCALVLLLVLACLGVGNCSFPFNSRCCLRVIVLVMIINVSTDKLGRPLYFDRVGEVDVDGMLTLTTQEKLLRNHIAYNESLLVDM